MRRTLLLAALIATTSFAHNHEPVEEGEETPHWLLGVEAGAGSGIGDVSFELLVRGGFQFLPWLSVNVRTGGGSTFGAPAARGLIPLDATLRATLLIFHIEPFIGALYVPTLQQLIVPRAGLHVGLAVWRLTFGIEVGFILRPSLSAPTGLTATMQGRVGFRIF